MEGWARLNWKLDSGFMCLRYKLATLFMVTAVIAFLLGFAQSRRNNLLQEITSLEALGFDVPLRNSGLNWLWPRTEGVAGCNYADLPNSKVEAASRVYTVDEWLANHQLCCDRLRNIGVDDVLFMPNGWDRRDWYYVSTKRGK